MIEVHNITKQINDTIVLERVSFTIPGSSVFCIHGEKGSGKSSLMRILTGVYRPDSGTVVVDDRPVFDNPVIKNRLFFVPDDPYMFPGRNVAGMTAYYRDIFGRFDRELFDTLASEYGIKASDRISSMTSGRLKSVSLVLAMSLRPDYIFIDDPVTGTGEDDRQAISQMIGSARENIGAAVIYSICSRDLGAYPADSEYMLVKPEQI